MPTAATGRMQNRSSIAAIGLTPITSYGLSAECGLKAVMRALGMQVDDEGAPIDKEHRKHIDKLWLI